MVGRRERIQRYTYSLTPTPNRGIVIYKRLARRPKLLRMKFAFFPVD